jgi:hypothetical protein
MHAQNAQDVNSIAEKQAVAALTRAQSKAISAATHSPIDKPLIAMAEMPKLKMDDVLSLLLYLLLSLYLLIDNKFLNPQVLQTILIFHSQSCQCLILRVRF